MKKLFIILIISFYFLSPLAAQKSTTKAKSNQSSKKDNGNSESSGNSKSLGIGLRLGDPLGITMKAYLAKVAVEFSIGRSFMWGYDYDKYYRYNYSKYPYALGDPRNPNFYDHYYNNRSCIAMQLHIMRQKEIKGVEGLDFYFGAGPQFRIMKYTFQYRDKFGRVYYQYPQKQIGIGVDVVGGLEYTMKSAPITFFGDINLYMEFYEYPFWLALQGGVGARVNF